MKTSPLSIIMEGLQGGPERALQPIYHLPSTIYLGGGRLGRLSMFPSKAPGIYTRDYLTAQGTSQGAAQGGLRAPQAGRIAVVGEGLKGCWKAGAYWHVWYPAVVKLAC